MIHHPHYISQFAEAAQKAVWADGLDVAIAASILPSAGVTPAKGGYRIAGQFPFASGVNHSRWLIAGGMVEAGGHPEWTFFLVERKDFKIVDNWFTGAMRATGSNTAVCEAVFVPERSHRAAVRSFAKVRARAEHCMRIRSIARPLSPMRR